MTCECATDAVVLVMGRTQSISYTIIADDDAGPVNLTGKTVSANAVYGSATLLAPVPTTVITTALDGLITVTFTSSQLDTIGAGKNVQLAISLWNADGTQFDRVTDTLITDY